jgi:hypothetical protein
MPYIDTKTGLRAGVDVNQVPVGFQWDVLRQFTDDAGNVLGEARVSVPVTSEELAAHISAALAAQAADIAEDAQKRAALVSAIRSADQQWDDAVQAANDAWKAMVTPLLDSPGQ